MTPEFETMAKEWRDKMLDDWGAMAKSMVGSEGFAAASAATMDWNLMLQKQTRSQMGQWLEAMEIPKRSDFARLNKHIMAVEQRVVDCEERLDELNTTMKRVASQLEKLNSRSNNQPDLSDLMTQIEELNRRLAEQPAAAAPSVAAAPKASRPRTRTRKKKADA